MSSIYHKGGKFLRLNLRTIARLLGKRFENFKEISAADKEQLQYRLDRYCQAAGLGAKAFPAEKIDQLTNAEALKIALSDEPIKPKPKPKAGAKRSYQKRSGAGVYTVRIKGVLYWRATYQNKQRCFNIRLLGEEKARLAAVSQRLRWELEGANAKPKTEGANA